MQVILTLADGTVKKGMFLKGEFKFSHDVDEAFLLTDLISFNKNDCAILLYPCRSVIHATPRLFITLITINKILQTIPAHDLPPNRGKVW